MDGLLKKFREPAQNSSRADPGDRPGAPFSDAETT
jgi:hypothetical protein